MDVTTEQRRRPLPPGLAAMAPGPGLLTALQGVEGSRLADEDTVTVAQAWDRQLSATTAGWYDALLEVALIAPGPPEQPTRWAVVPEAGHHEVRAALVCSAEVAQRRVRQAEALRLHYPALGQALADGDVDAARVQVFLRAFAGQRPLTCASVLAEVLPIAASLAPGELASRLDELLIDADPDAAEAGYDQAVARRRLIGLRNRDGSVDLVAQNAPVDQTTAAADRVEAIVTAAKNSGHPQLRRTLRADVALGLLDGPLGGLQRPPRRRGAPRRRPGRAGRRPGRAGRRCAGRAGRRRTRRAGRACTGRRAREFGWRAGRAAA